jgi:hypothetical protein
MSLINDALKRVKQAPKKPNPAPASGATLQPVENTSSPHPFSKLILPVSLLAAGVAGWFLWQWWNSASQPIQVGSTPGVATNMVTTNRSLAGRLTGALATASNVVQSVTSLRTEADAAFQTNLISSPNTNSIATSSPPASGSTNIASVPVAVAAQNAISPAPQTRNAAFPALTLQGIYFRLSKPSALINNRTLYLGDVIEGARVIGIERFAVKLEMEGKTKELSLERVQAPARPPGQP